MSVMIFSVSFTAGAAVRTPSWQGHPDVESYRLTSEDLTLPRYDDIPSGFFSSRIAMLEKWFRGENPERRDASIFGKYLKFVEIMLNNQDMNPVREVDFTIGQRLKTYLVKTDSGTRVFVGVVWGDLDLAPIVFLPGATTDALHMWADIGAKVLDTQRTLLFFDPIGMGYSDTPEAGRDYAQAASDDALLKVIKILGIKSRKSPIFVSQSWGYIFSMSSILNQLHRCTFSVAVGTNPEQYGIYLSEFLNEPRELLAGQTLLEATLSYSSAKLLAPEDFVYFLPLGLGDGVPRAYLDFWSRRTVAQGGRQDLLRAFYQLSREVPHYVEMGQKLKSLALKKRISQSNERHFQVLMGGERDPVTTLFEMNRYGAALNQVGIETQVIALKGVSSHFGVEPSVRHQIADQIRRVVYQQNSGYCPQEGF